MASARSPLQGLCIALVAIGGVLVATSGPSDSTLSPWDRATRMLLNGCCCIVRLTGTCCCENLAPPSSSSEPTGSEDRFGIKATAAMQGSSGPPGKTCQCRSSGPAAPNSRRDQRTASERTDSGRDLPAGASAQGTLPRILAAYSVRCAAHPPRSLLDLSIPTTHLLI